MVDENGMVTHLKIEMIEQKPKTQVYRVISSYDESELGKISWYGPWRQYVFSPNMNFETVWSEDCVLELHKFLLNLKKDGI
jgi:hypothetical protein